MTATARVVPASQVSSEDLAASLWRRGDLTWKLDPHQLEVYEAFKAWDEARYTDGYIALCRALPGAMDSVWFEKIARRFGKTAMRILHRLMQALTWKGAVLTYGTAYQKDIGDIIVPLCNMLSEDAPDECRPRYKGSYGAYSSPVLHIPITDSVIKLVGVDKNPDGLRGRFSDGITLSEARDIRNLEGIVRGILLPQFQRRPHANLVLETSAPRDLDHDLITTFEPDCRARGAYIERTIDDNHAISDAEKERYIREAGGRGHPECEREYYNVVTRDPERMIVPEFSRERHVRPMVRPAYADCYTVMDPGMSDRCAIIWAYWDWVAQVLVVERSWAQFNAGTDVVARVLRDTEVELWGTLEDGAPANDNGKLLAYDRDKHKLRANPYQRWTDVDLRLAHDLKNLHGIHVQVVDKPAKSADADVQMMRLAFGSDQVVVLPDSGPLADELEAGKRKEGGSPGDWERSPVYGHFDCLAALKYLLRKVQRARNPFPPDGALLRGSSIHREPWADYAGKSRSEKALGAVFGGGGRRRW